MTLEMKLEEARELGNLESEISIARKGRELTNDYALMMRILSVDRERLDYIYDMIDAHPEMSDSELADEIYYT